MPKIDIPTYSGSYTLWPPFIDLYVEAINDNSAISKVKKNVTCKGKVAWRSGKAMY